MAQISLPMPTLAAERYVVELDGIDWEFYWVWNVRGNVWLLSLSGPQGPVFLGKPLIPRLNLIPPRASPGLAPQGFLYLLQEEAPGYDNTDAFDLVYSPQSIFLEGEVTVPSG